MKKIILAFILAVSIISTVANAQSVFKFDNDLSTGATGTDVLQLQSWLINNGFDIPAISSGQANKGFFGSQTRNAVAKYQESVGIPNTGFFGPLTRNKVNTGGVKSTFLNVLSPNGGEQWPSGSTQTIRWSVPQVAYTQMMPPPPLVRSSLDINLIPYNTKVGCPFGYVCQPSAEYLLKLNRPITNIVKNISIDNGSYVWNIPGTGLFGDYIMQICQTGTSICAESKTPFTITPAITPTSVTVLSPNGGENWVNGTTRTISWKLASGMDQNTKVDIYLVSRSESGVLCAGGVPCPAVTKVVVTNLDKNISSTAPYNWIVGTDIANKPIAPGMYIVRICITGTSDCAESKSAFTTSLDSAPLTIVSPNGGEQWASGSTQTIKWNNANYPASLNATTAYVTPNIDITLIPIKTTFFCPVGYGCMNPPLRPLVNIAKNVVNAGSYTWNIPASGIEGQYTMQICQTGTSNCAESKTPFTITPMGDPRYEPVTVLSPNGNENWTIGTTRTISWKLANGMDQNTKVDIFLVKKPPLACNDDGNICVTNPVLIAPINLDKNISSTAPYNWIVGTDIINNPITPGTYKVQICITGSTNCDNSDNDFTLVK